MPKFQQVLINFFLVMACASAEGGLPDPSPVEKHSATRRALIIANQDYEQLPDVEGSLHNARIVQLGLLQSGFSADKISIVSNLDRLKFLRSLSDFAQQTNGAEIALIYYTGHGVQRDGVDFLSPVDIDAKMQDPEIDAISVRHLLRVTDAAQHRILFLDAGRDDPSPKHGTRMHSSIHEHHAPGTYLIFSAAPGAPGQDGTPFARSLAKWIAHPGLDISRAVSNMHAELRTETKSRVEIHSVMTPAGRLVIQLGREMDEPKPGALQKVDVP